MRRYCAIIGVWTPGATVAPPGSGVSSLVNTLRAQAGFHVASLASKLHVMASHARDCGATVWKYCHLRLHRQPSAGKAGRWCRGIAGRRVATGLPDTGQRLDGRGCRRAKLTLNPTRSTPMKHSIATRAHALLTALAAAGAVGFVAAADIKLGAAEALSGPGRPVWPVDQERPGAGRRRDQRQRQPEGQQAGAADRGRTGQEGSRPSTSSRN